MDIQGFVLTSMHGLAMDSRSRVKLTAVKSQIGSRFGSKLERERFWKTLSKWCFKLSCIVRRSNGGHVRDSSPSYAKGCAGREESLATLDHFHFACWRELAFSKLSRSRSLSLHHVSSFCYCSSKQWKPCSENNGIQATRVIYCTRGCFMHSLPSSLFCIPWKVALNLR